MSEIATNRRLILQGALAGVALAGAAGAARADSPPTPKYTRAPNLKDDPFVARTTAGLVRGAPERTVLTFRGIPYGEPTDGANRFMPPKPAKSWAGVRDAYVWGPSAPQVPVERYDVLESWDANFDDWPQSEDCLILNVWTPTLRDGKKRPVLFYLHGGGFHGRSGSRDCFNGANLARIHDVVVVTINQRLNAFGYMYLAHLDPKFADSGSSGTLDSILALQWVRDNIAEFGGDPGSVTIFGQSGGGAKVSALLGSPAAKGLFHKAIVQSGSMLSGMTREQAIALTNGVLANAGLKPGDASQLQTMPAEQLVAAMVKAKGTKLSDRAFGPVVDGRTLPAGPYSPQGPAVSADVPMMIGTARTETTMLLGAADDTVFHLTEADMRKRLGAMMDGAPPAEVDRVVAAFRATRPGATPSDLFFHITTFQRFRSRALAQAEAKFRQGRAPVYTYEIGCGLPPRGDPSSMLVHGGL